MITRKKETIVIKKKKKNKTDKKRFHIYGIGRITRLVVEWLKTAILYWNHKTDTRSVWGSDRAKDKSE